MDEYILQAMFLLACIGGIVLLEFTHLSKRRDALSKIRVEANAIANMYCRKNERLVAEVEALTEHLRNLLAGDVGRMTLDKLRDGQATETADGKAWLAARAAMAAKERANG